jgi:hypothetical protein
MTTTPAEQRAEFVELGRQNRDLRRAQISLMSRARKAVIEAARTGFDPAEAAALIGVAPTTAEAWIAKAAVPRPPRSSDARVIEALAAAPNPLRQREIVDATGMLQGTVSKSLKRLANTGRVIRAEDGTLSLAA